MSLFDVRSISVLLVRQTVAGTGSIYDRACAGLDPEESASRVASGEAHVIRLNVLDHLKDTSQLQDLVHGSITFPHGNVDDQILVCSCSQLLYNS